MKSEQNGRNKTIDFVKGILIILVVIGHYNNGKVHDIIYLFHMPAFFIISGFLLDEYKTTNEKYVKTKVINLMIPYLTYMTIDFLFAKRIYNLKEIIKTVWGGRLNNGTYWYITCYCFAFVLFSYIIKKFSKRTANIIFLSMYIISIIESNLVMRVPYLEKPGIPGNIDVSFLACCYIAIGFYSKDLIDKLCKKDDKSNNIVYIIASIAMIVFIYVDIIREKINYRFDMKPVQYTNFIFVILVPIVFFVVLLGIAQFTKNINSRIYIIISNVGKMTIPIMYMHVPLNYMIDYKYSNIVLYCCIGLFVPIVFNKVFSKYNIMRKMFGLSIIREN